MKIKYISIAALVVGFASNAAFSASKLTTGLAIGSLAQIPAIGLSILGGERLETLDQNAHSRSFSARSPEEFRNFQLEAASYAKRNQIIVATALAAAGSGFAAGVASASDKTIPIKYRNKAVDFFVIVDVISAPLWAVKLAKINRRIKLHKRYARHAEALFALMHNPEFMKEMGVDSWEKVTHERLKTEKWAQIFGFVPLNGLVLKPIAKVAARRKRDIPGLEKVLNHYLDGLEGKRSKKKSKWLATKPQGAMVAA